jgi:DNA-binding NtrC family response regulator
MDNKDIGILIVDDELSVRDSLFNWFKEDGYRVDVAANAKEALNKLKEAQWDLMLIDIKMPGMDGLDLQKRIKEIDKNIIVIIMTAYASVETAVKSLKDGAFDYIVKPFDPDDLNHIVRNAIQQKKLIIENLELKEKISELLSFDEIIGSSPPVKRVLELVNLVSKSDVSVLIRGESGTGKELIAWAVHTNSSRRYFPIVTVNCGALTETLLESELFGHEKGAFTGAMYRRKGKIEMADGGTLFLDEIGDISLKTQIDLLRVLETKSFTRVGGNQTINVDFRLICATNRDLEKLVKEEKFREDLYYRINVFPIFIPPLRERGEDILLLARHFLKKFSSLLNKKIADFSEEAAQLLLNHDWPGNVRELENAVERAMVVGKGDRITPEDLPFQLSKKSLMTKAESLEDMEKAHIITILDKTGWNISRSAEILGIDRLTLYNKIKKYSLKKEK